MHICNILPHIAGDIPTSCANNSASGSNDDSDADAGEIRTVIDITSGKVVLVRERDVLPVQEKDMGSRLTQSFSEMSSVRKVPKKMVGLEGKV